MERHRDEKSEKRMTGSFVGLVVGDAIGAPYEFFPRGSVTVEGNYTEIAGSKLGIKKGEWTDDSAMALALADSLLSCNGFDPKDQMERYRKWAFTQQGYCSSRKTGFGFGQTFMRTLAKSATSDHPYPGTLSAMRAGNGCIMRLAPIPIWYADNVEKAVDYAGKSSMVTHGHPESVYAARLLASIACKALNGASKEEILDPLNHRVEDDAPDAIRSIAMGQYRHKKMEEIDGTFFAAKSLEAALWCFHQTDNFKQAILLAVELGGDTDSTAAVCAQVAGAYYGFDGIPAEWVDGLVKRDEILAVAGRLSRRG